jgi:hypothetical protein
VIIVMPTCPPMLSYLHASDVTQSRLCSFHDHIASLRCTVHSASLNTWSSSPYLLGSERGKGSEGSCKEVPVHGFMWAL